MQQYTTAKIMRIARVVLLRTFQKIEFTQLFADSVQKNLTQIPICTELNKFVFLLIFPKITR